MTISQLLFPLVEEAIEKLFGLSDATIEFQETRKDFEGDITLVIFPLLKKLKGNPVEIGNKIGIYLKENTAEVVSFNVVSGFLNILISDEYYLNFLKSIGGDLPFGFKEVNKEEDAVLVEYSSPNTNKPLHLGHVRNNLLGYSVAEILKASGKKVYKTQIINDRGIHICKSMVAWKKFGNGETPESTGLKGDKIVGNCYVRFEKEFQKEYSEWIKSEEGRLELETFKGLDLYEKLFPDDKVNYEINTTAVELAIRNEEFFSDESVLKEFKSYFKDNYFNKYSLLGKEVKQMLQDWESGDEKVIQLWKTMNQWVYDGFAETYKKMGVDFDSYYYESNTYLLGKDVVEQGLADGVFEKDPDGSVWIDLKRDGLDRKIVLRSDGTSVYMTQDIGTAIQRTKDFPDVGGMVYTVGNEQDYHFKVLFLILKKLGFDWAKNLFHLSYGMVDLPSGKMKSREGTVVDADDLMNEMSTTAQKISEELGKLEEYSDSEKRELYNTIGMGALKYYILKVDPKKRILFNPEESVDFAGNTGPFIQYTYARIQSILRKAKDEDTKEISVAIELDSKEKELLKVLASYPEAIQTAALNHSPALIANFTYDLVKAYNSFYQTVPILGETDSDKRNLRVQLSRKVADTIASAFGLLGISVPERM